MNFGSGSASTIFIAPTGHTVEHNIQPTHQSGWTFNFPFSTTNAWPALSLQVVAQVPQFKHLS